MTHQQQRVQSAPTFCLLQLASFVGNDVTRHLLRAQTQRTCHHLTRHRRDGLGARAIRLQELAALLDLDLGGTRCLLYGPHFDERVPQLQRAFCCRATRQTVTLLATSGTCNQ